MKILQKKYSPETGLETLRDDGGQSQAYHLVFVFSSTDILSGESVKKDFPSAAVLLDSTVGDIADIQVSGETISLTENYSLKKDISVPDIALLGSCVGRKLALDQRIEEEREMLRKVFGNKTAITGFYSYGDIAPSFDFLKCELHSQTMTNYFKRTMTYV